MKEMFQLLLPVSGRIHTLTSHLERGWMVQCERERLVQYLMLISALPLLWGGLCWFLQLIGGRLVVLTYFFSLHSCVIIIGEYRKEPLPGVFFSVFHQGFHRSLCFEILCAWCFTNLKSSICFNFIEHLVTLQNPWSRFWHGDEMAVSTVNGKVVGG